MGTRIQYRWLVHVSGWILFLSLALTIVAREPQQGFPLSFLTSGRFLSFALIYVFLFYFNLLYLLPKLFFRKKYLAYSAAFAAFFLGVYFSQPFEKLIFRSFHQEDFRDEMPTAPPEPKFRPAPRPPRTQPGQVTVDFVSLVLFLVVWIVGMAVRLSEQWRLSEQRAARSEADKAQAELSFFKAQINPHFLFNTLNNIYALAVGQSEHTAPSIMKLSQMMRYITEEATENYVPLEDEIACLTNYIDLQKLRLNAKTQVRFEVSGTIGQVKIAPLIFMTFVENAFKYGVSNHYAGDIIVKINSSAAEVSFLCQNKNFDQRSETARTGVGIVNTRKRLDYLYAGRYDLNIEEEDGLFTVNLTLKVV